MGKQRKNKQDIKNTIAQQKKQRRETACHVG